MPRQRNASRGKNVVVTEIPLLLRSSAIDVFVAGFSVVFYRRQEASAESTTCPDIKTGNHPKYLHDCYSTVTGYQLAPAPPTNSRKCDYVTWIAGTGIVETGNYVTRTGSGVIEGGATTTTESGRSAAGGINTIATHGDISSSASSHIVSDHPHDTASVTVT